MELSHTLSVQGLVTQAENEHSEVYPCHLKVAGIIRSKIFRALRFGKSRLIKKLLI
jgi:hypothetical protein